MKNNKHLSLEKRSKISILHSQGKGAKSQKAIFVSLTVVLKWNRSENINRLIRRFI